MSETPILPTPCSGALANPPTKAEYKAEALSKPRRALPHTWGSSIAVMRSGSGRTFATCSRRSVWRRNADKTRLVRSQ